ncbi:hypothetical protein [Streptomyces sp. NPDC008150]|uniref:hypothetical protein n=1 Tax=Streptomyces sp. NPDC008150 TaxID=3364816 RepID=UPI0036E74433
MAAQPPALLRTADPPPGRGGIALAQGRYGLRGNVELLLCDASDGLWVLWFNSDPPGTEPEPSGPPPGEWSGALRFGTGRRYDDVQIVQSRHGPHHLEVYARSGTHLHRLRWSPEAAFTTEDPPPAGTVTTATAAETTDGTPWIAHLGTDRQARLLRADPSGHPRLAWSAPPGDASRLPAGNWHTVLLTPLPGSPVPGVGLLGADGGTYVGPAGDSHRLPPARTGAVATAHDGPRFYLWTGGTALDVVHPGASGADRRLELPGEGPVTAIAATPLAHTEGRTDLVLRRGGRLWHLTDDGTGAATSSPVVSRLTSGTNDGPVHRG